MSNKYYYEYNRDGSDYFNKGNLFCNDHFHKAIELLYCISGEKIAFIDGEKVVLKAGELLFIPPFAVHSYLICDEYKESFCCVLPSSYSDIYKANTDDKRFLNLVFKNSEKAADVYKHLSMLEQSDELLKQGIHSYVLAQLIKDTPLGEKKVKSEEGFAVKTLGYIAEHYNEDINLESVAKALGYNRCYFSNMFNKHFHLSFSHYLNNIRINQSIPLLRKETVAAAAIKVGFKNTQNYFLNFKRVTGTTPKNYIREHLK